MPKTKKTTPAGTEIVKESTADFTTEIVVQDSQLSNFDPANQVEFAQKAAKALMVVIDATKPLIMQGKRYLYFEHWQTIARFFNTTVGIESTTKDQNGYIAKAVVYDKSGVVIGGAEASCMNDEKNWKGKPDFQLRSMAQTRAMSKALRSIYGFVAVLAGVESTPAEEMADVEIQRQPMVTGEAKTYPPSEKQLGLIQDLMDQKRLTPENLYDDGFDVKSLTGGKEGTASELISYLMTYIPKTQVTVDLGDRTQASREMEEKLNQAKDPAELAELKERLSLMRQAGKFTKNDLTKLAEVYKKTELEIMNDDPTFQEIGKNINL